MKTFLLRREMFSHRNFLSGTMLTLNFAAKLSISSRIWVVAEWCRKVYFVRLALIPRDTDIRENQWIICIKWNYPLCAGKSRSGDGRAILIFICYLYKEKQQMMLARGRDLYAANKLMVSDTLTALPWSWHKYSGFHLPNNLICINFLGPDKYANCFYLPPTKKHFFVSASSCFKSVLLNDHT